MNNNYRAITTRSTSICQMSTLATIIKTSVVNKWKIAQCASGSNRNPDSVSLSYKLLCHAWEQ